MWVEASPVFLPLSPKTVYDPKQMLEKNSLNDEETALLAIHKNVIKIIGCLIPTQTLIKCVISIVIFEMFQ